MNAEHEHLYKDPDGVLAWVKPSYDRECSAMVSIYDENIAVPAHRLAEFTRALWSAAGQPVPDLPVIYDPEMVEDLASDLDDANGPPGGSRKYPDMARRLLDAGWRKQW